MKERHLSEARLFVETPVATPGFMAPDGHVKLVFWHPGASGRVELLNGSRRSVHLDHLHRMVRSRGVITDSQLLPLPELHLVGAVGLEVERDEETPRGAGWHGPALFLHRIGAVPVRVTGPGAVASLVVSDHDRVVALASRRDDEGADVVGCFGRQAHSQGKDKEQTEGH